MSPSETTDSFLPRWSGCDCPASDTIRYVSPEPPEPPETGSGGSGGLRLARCQR